MCLPEYFVCLVFFHSVRLSECFDYEIICLSLHCGLFGLDYFYYLSFVLVRELWLSEYMFVIVLWLSSYLFPRIL